MNGYSSNWAVLQDLMTKVDIVAIQEHWLHDYEAKKKFESLGDVSVHTVCFDSVDQLLPTQRSRGQSGTALIWHNYLERNLVKITPICLPGTSRVCAITIHNTANDICLINAYLPSRGKSDSEEHLKETFQLVAAVANDHSSSDLILCGDFNSSFHRTPPNSHDQILRDVCSRHHWVLPDNYPATPTFYHPNGIDKSTIDYFMQSSSNTCLLHNIAVLNLDDDIASVNTSDHAPVIAEVEMSC